MSDTDVAPATPKERAEVLCDALDLPPPQATGDPAIWRASERALIAALPGPTPDTPSRFADAVSLTPLRARATRLARAMGEEGEPRDALILLGHHHACLARDPSGDGRAFLDAADPEAARPTLPLSPAGLTAVRALAAPHTDRRSGPTRDLTRRLAALADALEEDGRDPAAVAAFLIRFAFACFAQSIALLPEGLLTDLLDATPPDALGEALQRLFRDMATGAARDDGRLLRFGTAFLSEESDPLAVGEAHAVALERAARDDWRDIEPAIFGALLERALDPRERHRLGAHFTPRAYVERLVVHTLTEPLADDLEAARGEAVALIEEGRAQAAVQRLLDAHVALTRVRVLDPACGAGNFLYVALEHLQRLEAELEHTLTVLGHTQRALAFARVQPEQLIGLEINPRTARVAELVLAIGHLQWNAQRRAHLRPPEPLLHEHHNILVQDAALHADALRPRTDDEGAPVQRRDREADAPVLDREGAAAPTWPEADFILGNPPFIGTRRMRLTLGDGYVDALTRAYPDVPDNVDFVMYWWHNAARATTDGATRRFGLITTNSITQTFNRALLDQHLRPRDHDDPAPGRLDLVLAIPDHPWVDDADGADVRVAMTVATRADSEGPPRGRLLRGGAWSTGHITHDLRVGASPADCVPLPENDGRAFWGVKFYGNGFIVDDATAAELARADGASLARPFFSGRDVTRSPRHLLVIDCDTLALHELEARFPAHHAHLREHVWPTRSQNPRKAKRERWWILGENQPGMRRAIAPLHRYIATTETAKHRVFIFLPSTTLPEGTVCAIALQDAFHLGVLSSRVHTHFATAAGGRLGVGNDPRYNKTLCFDPFPFPRDVPPHTRRRVRTLAEALDALRAERLMAHPDDLTITRIYNAIHAMRQDAPLSRRARRVAELARAGDLLHLHDDLDRAVLDAYGWPHDISDDDLLTRVCELNAQRLPPD